MKTKKGLILLLNLLLLASCVNRPGAQDSSDIISFDPDTQWGQFYQEIGGANIQFEPGAIATETKASCAVRDFNNKSANTFSIFTFNDVHGALEDISKSVEYVRQQIANNPYSSVIANGDMFQGSAVSNAYLGRPMVEAMNCMGTDAMGIGNHEFDWGIERFSYLFDQDHANGEADFPFLGANIFQKSDDKMIDFTKDYVVIDRGDIKVGIVGGIGYGLESSIAVSKVRDYYFASPLPIFKEAARSARAAGADIVIATIHAGDKNYDTDFNRQLGNLTGEYKIDAIVNGHSHYRYSGKVGTNQVPVVQAGSSNEYIGRIDLTLNNKTVVSSSISHIDVSNLSSRNSYIDDRLNLYYQDSSAFFNTPLNKSENSVYNKDAVGNWIADTMKQFVSADIALVNAAGVRGGDHFPIAKNDDVTFADFIGMSPFDNVIINAIVKGSELEDLLDFLNNNYSSYYFSYGINKSYAGLTIDNQAIDKTKTYTIATVDYVFDKYDVFYDVKNSVNTEVVLNRIMRLDAMFANHLGKKWDPSKPSVIASC